jgi:hypothetical protein
VPRTADKDLLLVGSIQLESADAVLRASADTVGRFVPSLPDGETGARSLWIGYLAKDVYHGHPDIETVRELDLTRPPEVMGGENKWSFRVRTGSIPSLELGYAAYALESWDLFRAFKEQGKIPTDLRFQICFPATGSAFMSFFDDPSDWSTMRLAYEDAVRRDLETIFRGIPAQELVIQFDVCTELRDMQGALLHSPDRETKFDETIESVARLSANVPDAALLGVHWCYGTLGGWPMVRIESLDLCTRLTNAAVDAVDRRVDYVHMPVLRHVGDGYFEPARDLNLESGGPRVYLGLIHHTDGMEGFRERMEIARRHMPADFGVASVCGYGRLSTEETLDALQLHHEIGEDLAARRKHSSRMSARHPT